MEPENCWFVDVFPFPRGGSFSGSMFNCLGGVSRSKIAI